MRDAQSIIKRPLLTEKSARLRETGGAVSGRRPSWKKAFVTLKPGDNIEFFEGV